MTHSSRLFCCVALLIAAIQTGRAESQSASDVTCKSSWPANQNYVLKSRAISDGKIEYYGRYKMWAPSGNLDCRLRQIVFNVGRMVNDLPQGSANPPILSMVVQHGIFHCRAKDMTVEKNYTVEFNNVDLVEYTVDAHAIDGKKKKGIYYAKISVIGVPCCKNNLQQCRPCEVTRQP